MGEIEAQLFNRVVRSATFILLSSVGLAWYPEIVRKTFSLHYHIYISWDPGNADFIVLYFKADCNQHSQALLEEIWES